MKNADLFEVTLTEQYRELFKRPDYAMAAKRYTPGELAAKAVRLLSEGNSFDKTGSGIVATCKALGVKNTYTAITAYLNGDAP